MALSNRQKNGIGCLVMALLLLLVAIRNTFFVGDISVTDASGLGVSRMVGAFLPAIIVGAIAAWLLQKPSNKKS